MMKIFLDDIRNPPDSTWTLVRSYDDFVKLVLTTFKPITIISFDHDLGMIGRMEAPSGMDAAKFFIDEVQHDPKLAENLDEIIVHSWNPIGAENILSIFKSAKKHGIFKDSLIIRYKR